MLFCCIVCSSSISQCYPKFPVLVKYRYSVPIEVWNVIFSFGETLTAGPLEFRSDHQFSVQDVRRGPTPRGRAHSICNVRPRNSPPYRRGFPIHHALPPHISYHLTFDIAMVVNRGWFQCPSCPDSFGSHEAVNSVLSFLPFLGLVSLISPP